MYKDDARDFANYAIFEMIDEKPFYICVCKESNIAEGLTAMLAKNDKDGDEYYYTGITEPGALVWGGGWHVSYKKGEDGKLHRHSLM